MNIVFFGTPEFAVPALVALAEAQDIDITTVVTQPDRPAGRGHMLTPSPIKKTAEYYEIPVVQPHSSQELLSRLEGVNADFFVVVAYGMILPTEIITKPQYGSINIHPSLLPRYRGATPIQESLLHGDTETGISIMKIDNQMDHGPLYLVKRVPIEPTDTQETLSPKLAGIGALLLPEVLRDIISGQLSPIPQNDAQARYCKKIRKQDGQIMPHHTAHEIINMLRAFTPWPGVSLNLGGKTLKILEAEAHEATHPAGSCIVEAHALKWGTSNGTLSIKKLQPEGKKPMEAEAFVHGYRAWLREVCTEA